MGDTEISPTNHAIHLGIPRTETRENEANIKDRISLARKTMYALMNTGLHGSNGKNPSVALRIYEAYVLPKLVYGMEVLSLNQKQLGILSKFHIDNPRKFQSLPIRTATSVIYLLIGAMPIEAEIHKRQLSFLHNILNCNNDNIRALTDKQLIMNVNNPQSFFCRASATLEMYNLPTITELKTNLPSKLNWKYICKKAIKLFWTENLQIILQDKISLRNVNTKDLQVGSTHLVWTSLPSNVADIRKGITKCRMLTGTYLVQKDKHRFSNGRVDPICPLCGVGNEDIEHMLTRCSALHCIRKDQFTRFKELVVSYI
jgi:hypothetical protein